MTAWLDDVRTRVARYTGAVGADQALLAHELAGDAKSLLAEVERLAAALAAEPEGGETRWRLAHARCSNAGKQVKCDRCGREYVCRPGDDFYCAAEGDHCCERCLLSKAGVSELHTIDLVDGGRGR